MGRSWEPAPCLNGKTVENIKLEKHYAAFKWAVSVNWKDKNGLFQSIQGKVNILKLEYGLPDQRIVDELFEKYLERGHCHKFDESRGSLNNWIARYVDLYLKHLIRQYSIRSKNAPTQKIDPLDRRNWANLEWLDKDNIRDDPNYQPEIAFDPTNPEDLCIFKETLEFVEGHFSKAQLAYLMGEMDLAEAAKIAGCSSDAFRKRLDRRIVDFKNAMKAVDIQ
jgi:DNA-directed RNA polymerase specialized sigma24 family protein